MNEFKPVEITSLHEHVVTAIATNGVYQVKNYEIKPGNNDYVLVEIRKQNYHYDDVIIRRGSLTDCMLELLVKV